MYCPKCKKMTKDIHEHDAAHGIYGTHMGGSERYRCSKCGYRMLKFILD